MPDKEFKLKYKIRNKAAQTLKRVIKEDALIDTGTLYESIRINAKFTTEGNLRIEILAAYYFGFLNNGTISIEPYNLVRQFNKRLESEGIISEMYAQYIEWLRIYMGGVGGFYSGSTPANSIYPPELNR